jgi:hypothetical protein
MAQLSARDGPVATRRPGVVSRVALAVLVACALVWFAVPRQAKPAGLLSTWALATALPTSEDFAADWQYSLRGRVTPRPTVGPPAQKNPDDTFEPAECAYSPMDEIAGSDEVASVRAHPPGEGGQHGHQVYYWIWAVADGPALVSQYRDWLGRCNTYRYSYRNPETGATSQTTVVTTKVDIPVPKGVDAAAEVGGSDTSGGPNHIYYAVRGVLLQCDFGVRGQDLALARRLADQTVRKLLAL